MVKPHKGKLDFTDGQYGDELTATVALTVPDLLR